MSNQESNPATSAQEEDPDEGDQDALPKSITERLTAAMEEAPCISWYCHVHQVCFWAGDRKPQHGEMAV